MIEIGLDGGKNGVLWVLKGLGSFGSSSLVSSNILIRDGISSNIRKGLESMSASIVNEKSDGKNRCNVEEFHYF